MGKKCIKMMVSLLLSVCCLLSGCQRQEYRYNNLVSESSIAEFESTLIGLGISSDDVSTLLQYVQTYRNGSYATDVLIDGWHTSKLTKSLYDIPTVINMYEASPFEDINCRRAAYLLYRDFFTASGTVTLSDMADELASIHLDSEYDRQKYEMLFGAFVSDASLPSAILDRWADAGVSFTDSIQLVSLWGSKDGQVSNIHCGILYQIDGQLVFFEKTGPLLPYQISAFSSDEMLQTYLLNYDDTYKDMTVFINDNVL